MSLLIATFRIKKDRRNKIRRSKKRNDCQRRACVCAVVLPLSSRLQFSVSREITDSDGRGKSGHHAVRKTFAGSAMRDFCIGFFGIFHSMLHPIVQPVPRFGNFACFSLSCLTEWCATIARLASLRCLLVSLLSRARKLEGPGLTVLLTFNSRRRQVFFSLAVHRIAVARNRNSRTSQRPTLSVLKMLVPGTVGDKRNGFKGLRCSGRFLKRRLDARFGIRGNSLYLALRDGVPPSVRLSTLVGRHPAFLSEGCTGVIEFDGYATGSTNTH